MQQVSQTSSFGSSARRRRSALPTVLTSFVGRKREMSEISGLLASARLLTLTGAAGCGKTRLALHVTHELQPHYRDGVYWVELAQLEDPLLLLETLADALEVNEQFGASLFDTILEVLQNKQLLLVLDNCEHLLAACAELVEALLLGTEICLLATSREPLGVAGERLYPITPMALPAAELPLAELTKFDAIQLFVERAKASIPQFALSAENAGQVVAICRRLDGIPLAIELASARLKVLTPQQIATRLDDCFALLASAAHLTHTPHQTLRAAIEWSYQLLAPMEQRLLRRMSIFVAGCSLEALEAVCTGDDIAREELLDLLASLVNKSLVVAETLQASAARYSLLEMIRQYAHEQLLACHEWETTHNRHLDWFQQLVSTTVGRFQKHWQPAWRLQMDAEHGNMRIALGWALAQGRIEAGLHLANALFPSFWETYSSLHEGLAWLERLCQRIDDTLPLELRVMALTNASYVAMYLGLASSAEAWGQVAVDLCEASGTANTGLLSMALSALAAAARTAGDVQRVNALNERIIALLRVSDEYGVLGIGLYAHGMTAIVMNDYAAAQHLLDEALSITQQSNEPYWTALILAAIGDLARCQGRFAAALAAYETSLALLGELGAIRELPNVERQCAYACLHLGQFARARVLFRQSLAGQRALNNRAAQLQALLGFATLAAATGQFAASARLFAFVERNRADLLSLLDSADHADKAGYERYAAQLPAQLGREALLSEQAAGRALSLEQACAFALGLPELPITPAPEPEPVSQDLTSREREVVQLIARGLSNTEIAETLVLSKRTVEKHIANILFKLNAGNRAQIVRWAFENGMRA